MTTKPDTPPHHQGAITLSANRRGKGARYMRLIRSPENGRWYAQDESGQTVAHGFGTAAACAGALETAFETPPYEPPRHA